MLKGTLSLLSFELSTTTRERYGWNTNQASHTNETQKNIYIIGIRLRQIRLLQTSKFSQTSKFWQNPAPKGFRATESRLSAGGVGRPQSPERLLETHQP